MTAHQDFLLALKPGDRVRVDTNGTRVVGTVTDIKSPRIHVDVAGEKGEFSILTGNQVDGRATGHLVGRSSKPDPVLTPNETEELGDIGDPTSLFD